MPTISWFYGISVRVFYNNGTDLPPHFHDNYGRLSRRFRSTQRRDQWRPPAAERRRDREWASRYHDEQMVNWIRAQLPSVSRCSAYRVWQPAMSEIVHIRRIKLVGITA